LIIENPVQAFVEGRGTENVSFFRFEGERLSTTFDVGDVDSFREILREVLDWRLAQYLNRQVTGGSNGDIVCRVARAGDRPILFLPSSATNLNLELGPAPIQISGGIYEVVIRRPFCVRSRICLAKPKSDDAGLKARSAITQSSSARSPSSSFRPANQEDGL
jgi:hypothetical protein